MKHATCTIVLCLLCFTQIASVSVKQAATEEKGVYVDSALNQLKDVHVDVMVLEDGLRVLQLEAWNDSKRIVEGYRLVEWYDGNGMKIRSLGSKWLPFRIQGKSKLSLRLVAPTPKAKAYRIQLKKSIK